ncbi:type II toxin-antitoxin system VapC family toxin [Leptolyngbya sp. NIES-2104]|uniref:type II toxin-antitoxin system VapC family toxin n=1 Tax=Leptolyngbya sp. NIES-2104 TaxID=1552121 RepID=UPI00073E3241|nr:type II toxin-antitoxin system VapC family toxin [Leptolyngbya sp. NIES-2104]
MSYLLDTNIVAAIIKENEKALVQLRTARRFRARVCISCITYYETKRGLLYLGATRQLSRFEELCSVVEILLIEDLELIETASRIHADLRRRGRPIQDADILIAATAMIHSLTLISNDADLQNVQSLSLDNWL